MIDVNAPMRNMINQLEKFKLQAAEAHEHNLNLWKKIKGNCTAPQLVTVEKAITKNWSIYAQEKSGSVLMIHDNNNQFMVIDVNGKFTRKNRG